MRKYDVVYILKPNIIPAELIYSLRSVEKYLDHRKVIFVCGKPDGIEPDEHYKHNQVGNNKFERAKSSLIDICKNDKITKQFWLFNDDFYLLKPVENSKPLHRGFIHDHVLSVEQRYGRMTAYTRKLRECEGMLKAKGFTTFDYTLHAPMLIDRAKMLKALQMFPQSPMFRSIYGNYAMIGGSYTDDNKLIKGGTFDKGAAFFSTSDATFPEAVDFLEDRFPEPCKWEVVDNG